MWRTNTPRLLTLVGILIAIGCVENPPNMMDGMGGAPGDDGVLDMSPPPPDAQPEPDLELIDGPPLTIADLQSRGSWKSYHLPDLIDPFPEWDWAHLPLGEQPAVQGLRYFDFDLDYNPSGGGIFAVYHHGLYDYESRCRYNLIRCLEPIADWSAAHPGHAPIVVTLQRVVTMLPDIGGALDILENHILYALDDDVDRVFTPADALAEHPGLTLRAMLTEHGWPALDRARGKFIFVLRDDPGRENYRVGRFLDRVVQDERLLWMYADGDDPEDLAADDAAIALLGELTTDDQLAHARDLVERGYLVRSLAHDAEAYARAAAAGVHLIATRDPDGTFPPPEAGGWPVACNPVTAPPGCNFRQIENRSPP